jgi:hypothetical protein
MANKTAVTKKAVKKTVKKAARKSSAAVAATRGIHPPPCGEGEVEFIDAATGLCMCKKA